MLEKCLKCNTSFEVDQNLITPKLKFFKCSVCDNEWPVNLINKTEDISNEKLQKDLEAIRSEIKKKTDLLTNRAKKNQTVTSDFKNKNYNVKKKTVAQIAEEIAEASINKRSNKLNKKKNQGIKKQINPKSLDKINTENKSFAMPLIIFLTILMISSSVYFRNNILSLSHYYFPNFVEKYFDKIFVFLQDIKIPFYADFENLEIENFNAVYEDKSVKFFGSIKNKSNYPILTPSLKVIMTTEDGKILAETVIKSTKPFINSNDFLRINHLILTNKKYNNASIRATIMKKIDLSS